MAVRSFEPILDSPFNDILKMDDSKIFILLRHEKRGSSRLCDGPYGSLDFGGKDRANKFSDGIRCAFPDRRAGDIYPAHPGLGRKTDEFRAMQFFNRPSPEAVLFRKDDDAPALRGFVGKGGKLRRVRKFFEPDAGGRDKLDRLTVPEGDGAGLIQ